MLSPATRLRIQTNQVAAKVLDGEAIIINLSNGVYYSLAGVGGEVWTMIEAEQSLEQMTGSLSERYRFSCTTIGADLQSLAQQLLDENLVVTVSGEPSNTTTPTLPAPVEGSYVRPELQIYHDMSELLALDPPLPGLRRDSGTGESDGKVK